MLMRSASAVAGTMSARLRLPFVPHTHWTASADLALPPEGLLIVLDILTEQGELRFTRLSEMVIGVSQKMLTQTLRHMERDGLLVRTCILSCRRKLNTGSPGWA